MGNPRRPYDEYGPYDPHGRRPSGEDDGWVVAGEEPNGLAAYPPPPEPPPLPRPYLPPPQRPYLPPYPRQPGPDYGYAPPAAPPTRIPMSPARHRRRPAEADLPDEMFDDGPRPPMAPALTWAVMAYVVPFLLYLAWVFTRGDTTEEGCLDASGARCLSPRAEAAERLLDVLPAIGGALALALLVAIGLRWIAAGWHSVSVGFAAAVIGAGVATVVATGVG